MTYSIVARDAATGEIGVAVQSHFLGVGSLCPWAAPGAGAVATQAMVEPAYGPSGLELMARGRRAADALAELVGADPMAEIRQVAMVACDGSVAAHTGYRCIREAEHMTGDGWSVQANMMRHEGVPTAMGEAFVSTAAPLAERMVRALEAAEAAGGDIRGRQAAALIVVAPAEDVPMGGRLVDVRVDDHGDPLGELRRLVSLRMALSRMPFGGDVDAAAYAAAARGNPELWFWHGVALGASGQVEGARTALRRAFAVDEGWRELFRRLPAAGQFPDDADLIASLLESP